MQNPSSAEGLLQRAKARLRREGGAKHSPLWWWLYDHYAEVEEALARRQVTFVALAEVMSEDGIFSRRGKPADANLLRKTFVSVRADKERSGSRVPARPGKPARPGPVPGVRMLGPASPEPAPTPGAGPKKSESEGSVLDELASFGARHKQWLDN